MYNYFLIRFLTATGISRPNVSSIHLTESKHNSGDSHIFVYIMSSCIWWENVFFECFFLLNVGKWSAKLFAYALSAVFLISHPEGTRVFGDRNVQFAH